MSSVQTYDAGNREMMPDKNCPNSGGGGEPTGCRKRGFAMAGRGWNRGSEFSDGERKTKASASSSFSGAESLKSGFEGSSTITNSEGFQNLISASLSITAWPAFASWAASAGRAFCRLCCFVSIHRARWAPAARKREVSELPLRLVSSWIANGRTRSEQLHEGPFTGQPDSA